MNAAPALIAFTLSALLAAPINAGTLYKWVDKDGNVSYQDSPPPPQASRVEEKSLRGADPGAPALPPVVLYRVPDCTSCDLMRALLQRRKISFTEKNVEDDLAAQTEMKKKTGALSVPTVTVGDRVIKGYSEAVLDNELNAAGYGRTDAPAASQ